MSTAVHNIPNKSVGDESGDDVVTAKHRTSSLEVPRLSARSNNAQGEKNREEPMVIIVGEGHIASLVSVGVRPLEATRGGMEKRSAPTEAEIDNTNTSEKGSAMTSEAKCTQMAKGNSKRNDEEDHD